VALEYYEGGKQISPRRIRQLYFNFYRRFRKENTLQDLRQQAFDHMEMPRLIEEPRNGRGSEETA
jgi:hypothetical protein